MQGAELDAMRDVRKKGEKEINLTHTVRETDREEENRYSSIV